MGVGPPLDDDDALEVSSEEPLLDASVEPLVGDAPPTLMDDDASLVVLVGDAPLDADAPPEPAGFVESSVQAASVSARPAPARTKEGRMRIG